jgi:hypothetical protein
VLAWHEKIGDKQGCRAAAQQSKRVLAFWDRFDLIACSFERDADVLAGILVVVGHHDSFRSIRISHRRLLLTRLQ